MSKKSEKKVLVIPLSRAYRSPNWRRSEKTVFYLKKFIKKAFKESKDIKIEPVINEEIWRRGSKTPPKKIVVEVEIDEEKNLHVKPVKEESENP